MMKFISYAISEPESNEYAVGYKFPFNASEILSSENTYLIDKFFEDSSVTEEGDKYEELDEYEGEKVKSRSEEKNDQWETMKIEDNSNEHKEENTNDILDQITSAADQIGNIKLEVEDEEQKQPEEQHEVEQKTEDQETPSAESDPTEGHFQESKEENVVDVTPVILPAIEEPKEDQNLEKDPCEKFLDEVNNMQITDTNADKSEKVI